MEDDRAALDQIAQERGTDFVVARPGQGLGHASSSPPSKSKVKAAVGRCVLPDGLVCGVSFASSLVSFVWVLDLPTF
ncbi:hypothetical protein ACFWOX_33215 [Streptomyces sp. NPDC058467]|uniref:hypothetical protein n=1 Tax=unclassified Streptomyces TaxID=2593676 RepID=UPI003650DBD7